MKISEIVNPCDTYLLKHKETGKERKMPVWRYNSMGDKEKEKYEIFIVEKTSMLR